MEEVPLPVVPICTILSNTSQCVDKNREEGKQVYDMNLDKIIAWQCLSPESYGKYQENIIKVRAELIKLRRKKNRKK